MTPREPAARPTQAVSHPVHTLALELGLPEEEVARAYVDELERVGDNARVRSFLPIFAVRPARAKLTRRGAEAR